MDRVALLLVVSVLLGGCTRTRWECEACLKSDPTRCAKSSKYRRDSEESVARCSAGSELCSELEGEAFTRVCRGKQSDPMFGCEPAFLDQLAFTCSSRTELSLPVGGVK